MTLPFRTPSTSLPPGRPADRARAWGLNPPARSPPARRPLASLRHHAPPITCFKTGARDDHRISFMPSRCASLTQHSPPIHSGSFRFSSTGCHFRRARDGKFGNRLRRRQPGEERGVTLLDIDGYIRSSRRSVGRRRATDQTVSRRKGTQQVPVGLVGLLVDHVALGDQENTPTSATLKTVSM